MLPHLDQLNTQTNSTKSIWSLCWSLLLSFFSLFSTWLPVKNRRQLPLVFYPLRQCKLPGNKCLLEFENLTLWNNTPIKLYINRRVFRLFTICNPNDSNSQSSRPLPNSTDPRRLLDTCYRKWVAPPNRYWWIVWHSSCSWQNCDADRSH